MGIQVPNPIFRQEEWFRYIVGADSQPTGGPLNRLEEWYAWMASMLMPKSGGMMTGSLNMDGNAITGLPETTTNSAAVSYGQVTDMIEAVAGIYRGAFATYAALTAVQWQTTDPTAANYVTNNDWAVVLADETHSDQCWRYGYTVGTGWQAQFKINEEPLSQAQIDALNSGITAAILTGIINSLAPAYDDTAGYSVGDHCTHDGRFYVCSTAIPTGGETWNAAHWTATSLADAFTALADKAPLASPAFTGAPTAPTPTTGDSSTKIATTAYVQDELPTGGDGIVIEGKAINLIPKYNDYLIRATFETPVLTLTMSGVGGAKEIGTPLTVSAITHSETNADNIESGTLQFYRNGTAQQAVTPSETSASVELTVPISEPGTSAGSVSYKLQCVDALGDTQSSNTVTATWQRYVYSKVGDPTEAPTSATNCVKQANLATFAANGADFTYAVGDCIWLLTTNAGAKIQTNVLGQWVDVTYYSGGSVTFTQENGATATYYAYRTDAFIGAGTAKYRVTNP